MTTNQSLPAEVSRVAIIGGGQLGFLLCEAAGQLGVQAMIVTPDENAPALSNATETIVCAYDTPELATRIAEWADTVTFEFEAVPDTLLLDLEAEQLAGRIRIYPHPATLRLLKNKAKQKGWLQAHDFPTAAFIQVSMEEAQRRSFGDKIEYPFVQKAAEGGYDGYGVQIIYEPDQLERFWPVPSIIETYLGGARELAVVVARTATGAMEIFPTVELTVDPAKNILDLVIAPADLPAAIHARTSELAQAVISELDGVGIFAVEMFLTREGQVLVNEISPRVHNSGHHTLESCSVSQFEQHMRAVSGRPLLSVEQKAPAVMKNILYEDSLSALVGLQPGILPVADQSARVHWYGKREARPGR